MWCSECGEIWVNTGNSKLGDKTECPYCHHQLDANRSTYSIPGTGFSYVQETGYKEGEIGENVNDSREVGVDDSTAAYATQM